MKREGTHLIITRIEQCGKDKYKVYIEYEYAFLFYKNDIRKYQLKENEEIEESVYEEIVEETIYRRAKQKALAILKYMDRTEYELRQKLAQAMYPSGIIERTISYVYSYHYLDDMRYVKNYIACKKNSKSKQQMIQELKGKGISKEMLSECLIDEVEDGAALQRLIQKKVKDINALSREEKQKVAAYLYRKGFQNEDIRRHLFL